MTTLSLERLTRSSRRTPATLGLQRFAARQATAIRASFDAAAAYDRAQTDAARRAVLAEFTNRLAG
jgi:hypothetical protein